MNKMMKICALVFISANLFQGAASAQGLNRANPFRQQMQQQMNQMSPEQREDFGRMRQQEGRNPTNYESNVQGWSEYHERWSPEVSQADSQADHSPSAWNQISIPEQEGSTRPMGSPSSYSYQD